MLQSPFDKTQFLQDILDVFNVIPIYINIPIPANKCMQYSKQKCSIPFFISAIFLWSNAVCFCRTISLWNIKCSFKRYTMPFGGVQCAFNKISFERGPQGERGPGLEASKINFDRVFAFVWKTRSKLILGASRAKGTFLARTSFTLGARFKGNLVISTCLTFLSKEQYPF